MRLVLAGQVILDRVLRIPALPPRGGDVLATSAGTAVGGGFNILTAAVRAGLPAVYAGAHGTGPVGDRVRAALADLGVRPLLAPDPAEDTGFTVALTDDGGERTFVTHTGAEAHLTADVLLPLADQVRPTDLVYLSGYGLAYPDNGPALAAFAAALDPRVGVLLDPGPLVADIPADRLAAVVRRCTWISCNQREGEQLSGAADPDEAVRRLAGPERGVLLRSGADGCRVRAPGAAATAHVPGFDVPAVDLNGAGDAHTGTFLAFLAEGADPVAAARAANAAAALAVTREGPATAPDRAELDAFRATRGPARRDGPGPSH